MTKRTRVVELSPEIEASLAELGRMSAARRQPVEHTCVVCGKPFTGLRQARYCSATCRTNAYRHRKRETAGQGAGNGRGGGGPV